MGFFKEVIKQATQQLVMQNLQKAKSKNKSAKERETLAEREKREKQMLADRIRAQAKEQAQQYLKIVRDCAELVNTTVNPDVFFNRYALMLEHLETLAGLECTGIFENSSELPSVAYARIDEQYTTETNTFLDRSFEDAKKHADTLKTENGKKNAINRYFDNMEKYIIHMSGESTEYFDKMKDANKNT